MYVTKGCVVSASTRKLLVPEGNSFCSLLFLFSCLQLFSRYKAYHTVDGSVTEFLMIDDRFLDTLLLLPFSAISVVRT